MYGTVAAADGRVSGATAAAAAECMCGGVIIQHFMPLPEFRPPGHQLRKLPSRTSEGYRGLGLGLGLVLGYDLKLEFRYN